ncbi:MAG: hypothetical protein ABMA00_20065 [Gemmatimonas sp.]
MLRGLLLATMLVYDTPTAHTRETSGVVHDSTRQFPRVEGANLEGRRFSLPADFESEYNVVLVAFRREQQVDVETWLPFLRAQRLAERGIRVYELPTLNRSYRMVRRFIDGGMARGIPDKATREVTITLYIDKSPFKKALEIATEGRICALVVARDGRVLWRADGRFTEAIGSELAATLDSLKGR